MPDQPLRLWDKGAPVAGDVLAFTTGDDPILDRALAPWDCLASAAHARTLHRAGLLTEGDLRSLLTALAAIRERAIRGEFDIPPEWEDGHTAIEVELTRLCGETGQRIHLGRSRNDQVAAAMRLYLREAVFTMLDGVNAMLDALLTRIKNDGGRPLPGFTHLQPAMPSSIGQWLHAFAEHALELFEHGRFVLSRLDRCPLGTGAGFGVPLALDRAYTASLLGFTRVQRSPVEVQNSRGRMERHVVLLAVEMGMLIEKLSWDLELYTHPALGLLSLPESMTTGSSIMPQKRNPDVLELLRARSARLRGVLAELDWVIGKLPSNYHRDFQETKGPTMRAAREAPILAEMMSRVIASFVGHDDRLAAAMTPEIFAAHRATQIAQEGVPFREAYRKAAKEPAAPGGLHIQNLMSSRSHLILPEALEEFARECEAAKREINAVRSRVARALGELFL